jgi:hypothetical protein
MHDRTKRTVLTLGTFCLSGASFLIVGCADRPEVQRSVAQVQEAVGAGAQGSLAERPTTRRAISSIADESANLVQSAPGLMGAIPVRAPTARVISVGELPQQHPVGDSVAFDADQNHQDVTTARGSAQLGVAWHDAADGMWFACTDLQGHGVGSPVEIRALVSDEESLSAPAVVAAGDAFGIAWVDTENGRVRFQLVGADGVPRGVSSIIHDGLTDPQDAQLVFTGREFGLAAHLREGVYFARIDGQGRRIGAGQLFAEGEAVDGVQAVRWDGHSYSVAFSVGHDGSLDHREQRIPASRAIAFRIPSRRSFHRFF